MVRDPLSLPCALLIMTSSEVTEVREGDWTTGNFREILGLKIPAYFTSDPQLLSDFITNLQTRPDDVFIASYPKSGESKLIRWFDTYLQNLTLVALYKASLHEPGLIFVLIWIVVNFETYSLYAESVHFRVTLTRSRQGPGSLVEMGMTHDSVLHENTKHFSAVI